MNINDYININTFILLGTLFVGIIYLVVFTRRGASQASVESNQILRGLIEDQKEEILRLRTRQHDTDNRITAMQMQMDSLATKRDYLEKLIHAALVSHFSRDPSIVKTVQSLVENGNGKNPSGKEEHG